MKIPSFSPTIRRKEMDAVLSCMVSEKIGPGDINTRLIRLVREILPAEGAVALRSPALAIKYALKALDLSKESGVMLSALAPFWQMQTVLDLGYTPIILDVNEENALVTAETVEDGIKKGGRVLVLHETMGMLPDFAAISALGIPIIEDISQSAGAKAGEKNAGTFGVFSILGLEDRDILTAGGGAVLIAPARRDAIVLKKLTEQAAVTDILPDINCALGFVQMKEQPRNDGICRELYASFLRALMQSGNRTLVQQGENMQQAVYSFPVVLNSGFKEVQQYASRKDIEVVQAFEKTIAAQCYGELDCIRAKSLLLRCAQFPLYPRLGKSQAEKIAKVLSALP